MSVRLDRLAALMDEAAKLKCSEDEVKAYYAEAVTTRAADRPLLACWRLGIVRETLDARLAAAREMREAARKGFDPWKLDVAS
jgi:hypothetical protein